MASSIWQGVLASEVKSTGSEVTQNWLRPFLPGMYRLALALVGDEHEAQHASSAAAMKALAEPDAPSASGREYQRLQRLVVRECLEAMRFRAGDLAGWLDEPDVYFGEMPEAFDWTERAFDTFSPANWKEIKTYALSTLTPKDRAVLLLHDDLKFSTYRVAFLLDMPVTAVNARLARARQRLLEFVTPLCRANFETCAWT